MADVTLSYDIALLLLVAALSARNASDNTRHANAITREASLKLIGSLWKFVGFLILYPSFDTDPKQGQGVF